MTSVRQDNVRREVRPAVVVVDVQNGFCHPEGSRARAVGPVAAAPTFAIVPVVVELVELAREQGWPVWFTLMEYWPDDLASRRRRYPPAVSRRGGSLDVCRSGTWDARLVDELEARRQPEDVMLVKHRASAFFATAFEQQLRMRDIDTLIIAGTTTSYCVEATVRDAHARDLDVLVVCEAVADTDPVAQSASLAAVDRFHGVVCSIADLPGLIEAGELGGGGHDDAT